MKKVLSALAVAFGVAVARAEGSANAVIPSDQLAQLTTDMTALKEQLSTWASGFMPVILGIVGVFLVFWLLRFALGMVKSFSKSSR